MHDRMKSGLTIIFLWVSLSLFGQYSPGDDYNIPSLRRVRHDTTKINILLEKLGYKYENINPDSSIYFYTLALNIAKNSPAADENNGKLKNKFLGYQASAYRYIGIIYRTQGLFDKALKNYYRALNITEGINDKKMTGILYANIGNVLLEQKSYKKASWYYNKSLKTDQEFNDKEGISEDYTCIASVYFAQKDYKMALSYNQKALKIAEETGYKDVIPFCYTNIGQIREAENAYDEALENYSKALELSQVDKNMSDITLIYYYIANLHLTIAESTKNLSPSDKKYHLNKVVEIGETGFKYAKQLKSFTLQNSLSKCLQKAYKQLGLYPKAMEYAEIFISSNDSIFQENKTRIIAEMELKYNTEALAKDSELQQARLNKQNIVLYFLIGASTLIFTILLLLLRMFRQKKKANDEILNQHEKLVSQNKLMVEQSLLITDSINYAKRLQQVIFPGSEYLDSLLKDYFVLLKPKDIVSGDFYWATALDDFLIIAVADCTGHGVPGALMSMLGMSNLNEIVRHQEVKNSSEILDELRERIIKALNQKGDTEEQKDGLDIALCVINVKTLEMQYSGAYLPCIIIKNTTGELLKISGDKMPIGIHPEMGHFTSRHVQLEKGDRVYLMSDGYQDQFGGQGNHKFLPKRLYDLLLNIHNQPMIQQREILDTTIEDWKNNHAVQAEQTDDITILGFRIG